MESSTQDIEEFVFFKEGVIYEMTFGECTEDSIFYSFNQDSLGMPPFLLREWIVDGDTLKDFEFNEAAALVDKMNEFDQEANWALIENFGFIGLSTDKTYGSLNLLGITSNTTLESQKNNLNRTFKSLVLEGVGIQSFIIKDTISGCEDSLIVKIDDPIKDMEESTGGMIPDIRPLDTLKLRTLINTSLSNQCITNSSTIIDSISIDDCGKPQNGFLILQDNYCFTYTPNLDFTGEDLFCTVVCSPSVCDTTYILVTVKSDNIEVFNGLSPNNDGVNDFFTIQNIENYSENTLEVFNRWGSRVYKKQNYANDWDGSFDNLILPDGIYFYILKVMVADEPKVRSGYLKITR